MTLPEVLLIWQEKSHHTYSIHTRQMNGKKRLRERSRNGCKKASEEEVQLFREKQDERRMLKLDDSKKKKEKKSCIKSTAE